MAAETPWTPFNRGEGQETAMREATSGLADVRTIRRAEADRIDFAAHDGELVFGFVLDGHAVLGRGDKIELAPADAFVIPPGEAWSLSAMSSDLCLLHVTTARLG